MPLAAPTEWTMADVQSVLPGFRLDRIRTYPSPGTVTEQDLLEAEARSDRIFELIDGTLVEKLMASMEGALAAALIHLIYAFADTHRLGVVLAPDGLLRILPGQVRAPDVSFIRWERFPDRRLLEQPIFPLAPNLAIEVLSESNTATEMERKLHEYFEAGVELVWYIDPRTRTAQTFASVDRCLEIGPRGSLSGGGVIPGFELRLADLFAWIEGPSETN
jgi:Uma2 family endonuclease